MYRQGKILSKRVQFKDFHRICIYKSEQMSVNVSFMYSRFCLILQFDTSVICLEFKYEVKEVCSLHLDFTSSINDRLMYRYSCLDI